MTHNDVIRRVRFIGDFTDEEMIALFKLTDVEVTKSQVCNWLKKDEDPDLAELSSRNLASFLNGLIIQKRGRREGPAPVPEERLTNNMILQKLKIAFSLTSDDILELFKMVDLKMSAAELSAFFRKPGHRSYRPFMDQFLRNLLMALQLKHAKK